MTDRDGDSRMRNDDESGSEASSSSMFPNENTSTPPLSQSQAIPPTSEDTLMAEATETTAKVEAEHQDSTGRHTKNVSTDEVEKEENAPGYMWRNRRAVDDAEKCAESVLDKDFSLQEFGDIVMEQLQGQDPTYQPYAQLGQQQSGR